MSLTASIIHARKPRRVVGTLLAAIMVLATGCGHARGSRDALGGGAVPEHRETPPPVDVVGAYHRAGLLAHGEPLPFTGRVVNLATATPDTTLVLLTVGLPSGGLTFTHSGDSYRAAYEVTVVAATNGMAVDSATVEEDVVVSTFRESVRADESILFQRELRLAPGSYTLRLRLRDVRGRNEGADTVMVVVPRLVAGTLGTPAPYYEMVGRATLAAEPRLLVAPRATAVFGQDSALLVYLEGYPGPRGVDARVGTPVRLAMRDEGGVEVWRDMTMLTVPGGADTSVMSGDRVLASGRARLPVARLGVGASTLHVWRGDGGDSVSMPLFVTFGDDIPAVTFDDMLGYLRFFTSPARLESLRSVLPEERGSAWAAFLASVEEVEGVSGERALRDYFARIQVANQRYRDGAGPGWLSDRGMVFVAFGDPDQVESSPSSTIIQRGDMERWIYRERGLRLEFQDVNGTGQWRFAPASGAAFRDALAHLRSASAR